MINNSDQKIALLILDGWGLSAAWSGNIIRLADPQNYNYIWQTYPHWVLKTFDQSLAKDDREIYQGLGYSIISCGRFLPSIYSYIQNKIDQNELAHSQAINKSIQNCKENNSALHLCGLLSDNKKISHFKQIFPIIQLAKNVGLKSLFIHLILDSDSLNDASQLAMLSQIEKELEKINLGKIASISGRNWSFDDDATNERIIQTYRSIALGKGRPGLEAKQVVQSNTDKGIETEDIQPTTIINENNPVGKVNDFDSIIFFNFDDRSIKFLTSIFIGQDKTLSRKEVYNVNVATFSDYFYLKEKIGYSVAFVRDDLNPNLPHLLEEEKISQLYIIPDIKYQHLAYYFQGGDLNDNVSIEFRQISSNNNLDSLNYINDQFIQAIKQKSHNFIVTSIGECDYVAHHSSIKNVRDSIKKVDSYLGQIEAVVNEAGYKLIICSDHGFIEQLANLPDGSKSINHSKNPVPMILVDKKLSKTAYSHSSIVNQDLSDILSSTHKMTDIAPTILKMFKIQQPPEMTGSPLL